MKNLKDTSTSDYVYNFSVSIRTHKGEEGLALPTILNDLNLTMSQAETAATDNNKCNMVGLLGILIQVGLGVLSFSVLLIKRFRESPPRPWKIWMFDTSKQGVSQMLAHFINLTISIALTYRDSSSDECLWYFTTNILDNTIGVLICVFCLVLIEKRLVKKGKS